MHHRMMKKNDSNYYSGIIGGKTGYTSLAGNTLVTCAERDGMKLIAVVLNGRQTHYSDTKALLDFGFENFKSVAIADKDSTYQNIENDLSFGGIFPGETIKLSVDKDSVITLPANADFADVTSTLDYQLDDTDPETALARIDYMYMDRIVGQAYLEASVVPGYTKPPEFIEAAAAAEDPSGTSAAAENPSETAAAATAETDVETVSPVVEEKPELPDAEEPEKGSSLFSILKTVLIVLLLIGAAAASFFAFLAYREKKEEEERMIRRRNREQRRQEWGSSTEFNLIMQEHLRSKNQFKKRGFLDQIRDLFRR